MAGNYFDFGFHQRQALADRLSMMPLHAWLQMQAMRAAQEREKATDAYRRAMLDFQRKRLEQGSSRPISARDFVPYKGGVAWVDQQGKIHPVSGVSLPPRPLSEREMWLQQHPGKTMDDYYTAKAMDVARANAQVKRETLFQTPVGQLPNKIALTPDGQYWPDQDEPLGDAYKKGAIVLPTKLAEDFMNTWAAKKNLRKLLAAASILPKEPGFAAMIGPITRRAERMWGSKAAQAYLAAQTAVISYMRQLAHAGRIAQQEYLLFKGGITDATTYPALKAAVDQAEAQLDSYLPSLAKAGRDLTGSYGMGTGAAPMSAPTEPTIAPPPAGFVPVN